MATCVDVSFRYHLSSSSLIITYFLIFITNLIDNYNWSNQYWFILRASLFSQEKLKLYRVFPLIYFNVARCKTFLWWQRCVFALNRGMLWAVGVAHSFVRDVSDMCIKERRLFPQLSQVQNNSSSPTDNIW